MSLNFTVFVSLVKLVDQERFSVHCSTGCVFRLLELDNSPQGGMRKIAEIPERRTKENESENREMMCYFKCLHSQHWQTNEKMRWKVARLIKFTVELYKNIIFRTVDSKKSIFGASVGYPIERQKKLIYRF